MHHELVSYACTFVIAMRSAYLLIVVDVFRLVLFVVIEYSDYTLLRKSKGGGAKCTSGNIK